jgi:hypothetical protein
VDDDFRELEPHINDHPFQPGSWPDACGYVDEHGWTCGYTRAEHTHVSGAHPRQRRGSDSPIRVRVGLDKGGYGPWVEVPAGSSGAGEVPAASPRHPRRFPMVFLGVGLRHRGS